MDPSLLREREAFKKRALAQPTVEKRKQVPQAPSRPVDRDYSPESSNNKKQKTAPTSRELDSTGSSRTSVDYKTATPASNVRLNVLMKIVKYMRARHLQGEDYGLTVDEILDETRQYDVSPKIRVWLINESLPSNPRIHREGEKYIYKPTFDIKDKKGLIRLLEDYHVKGAGGIFMEDIEDSLPNAQKILDEIKSSIIIIKQTGPSYKRQIVFFKDPSVALDMPEDIVKLWRSVSVDGMDSKKIADYLDKHGISFIKSDHKLPAAKKRGKRGLRTGKFVPKHNEHVADLLQDYSAKLAK